MSSELKSLAAYFLLNVSLARSFCLISLCTSCLGFPSCMISAVAVDIKGSLSMSKPFSDSESNQYAVFNGLTNLNDNISLTSGDCESCNKYTIFPYSDRIFSGFMILCLLPISNIIPKKFALSLNSRS